MSLLIKGIITIPCLSVNLGRESAIGIKGEVGIGTAESELLVIILQLLLYLVGSNLATCLSQQILRSEGTTWLTVLPGITEIFLLECTRTDYIVQNSVDDASCAAARAARITRAVSA